MSDGHCKLGQCLLSDSSIWVMHLWLWGLDISSHNFKLDKNTYKIIIEYKNNANMTYKSYELLFDKKIYEL